MIFIYGLIKFLECYLFFYIKQLKIYEAIIVAIGFFIHFSTLGKQLTLIYLLILYLYLFYLIYLTYKIKKISTSFKFPMLIVILIAINLFYTYLK
ncbi:hypothetical protein CP985_08260 [Malaciobacter mytili LMG 24559]|uniref:Uncharacterized protein n=1 Tax=Malaciobacter mytili LMG 24559 TaxID=1032238 RepID=A0AAX2AH33_9BACT|nr:putative membrane protein [Malaciobacter mytili LMG 24559]RXK15516.1 hypothetical protein CP985_08260 [Malaciobacter mytili LMG 24559]